MTRSLPPAIRGHGFACLTVAVAVGVRYLLHPLLDESNIFSPILLAVLVTAYFFGLRPALTAVFVGALAADFFLLEPRGGFLPSVLAQQIGLVFYAVVGFGVAYLAGSMHDAQKALLQANRALEESVGKRTAELACRNGQLELSEERLRFALRYSNTGGWSLDLSDLTAHRTLEHDRIFGYETPLPEWTLEMFLGHVHPDDRAEVERLFQGALAAGAPWDFECRIRRADGAQRWIWARGEQERDGEGRPVRMAGIVQDITERKQNELVLSDKERLLRFVTSSARVGLVVIGPDYTYIFANDAYAQLYGLDPESIVGRRVSEVLPSAWPRIQPWLDRGLAGDQAEYELMLPGSEGQPPRYFAVIYEPRRGESGDPNVHVAVVEITKRKLAELALAERERLLAVVTGTARVGLVVVGRGYRYLFANEAYADIFGLETKELVGHRVPEILPDAWSQIQPKLDRALAGERVAYELEFPAQDGQPVRHFTVNYEPRVCDDEEPSVVVVVLEISARKYAELALAERERMLQFVTSSAGVGLVVLDSGYRYLFANEAYGRIYGIAVSDIVGRTVPEVIPLAWPQIKPHLDRSLGGTPGGFDLSLPPLPGTDQPRTLAVVYEPHAREDGSLTSVVVITDVSERKQASEAAARLSERVTLAARAAGLGIWDWDLIENQISWDDQMFSLYGRKRGDFGGAYEAWLAGIHPEDRARCDEESQQARDGLADYESEFRVIWPDGSLHYLKAIGEVFRDETGRPIRMLGVNFDVTEARLAQEAAQGSQAKLEAALASMTDAVFISDTSGNFVHFNDAFVTFHRFSARSECASHLSNYPDIIDVFLENGETLPLDKWAVPRALRGETASNAEYCIRRKDSGETWFGSYSFSPIRDALGGIVGSVVVGRDITERKRAAQEALEREERFRQLAENIREVFWLNDILTGKILYVSPAYESIWGRTCDALHDWIDAVHEAERPRVRDAFDGQSAGQTYDIEYRIVRPDGTLRWIHDRGFPVFNEAGDIYRVAGVAEDITERRLAEHASQQQQMRLEGIVNSAMDGIITVDEGQSVILMNAAAERMFGCRAEDIVGTRVERFIPERYRAAHSGHVQAFGKTGVAARAMGRFGPISGLRANGEEFPIEASISQIEVDGHKLFTVTCRDVTERIRAEEERRKLEAQLHQSQKMEAFGQLAGGVAHDFNNLLTIINGYSEWLLGTLPPEAESRIQLAEILKAGERAASLTHQLLTFSRQQLLEPKVLKLNAVVDEIESMLRRLIGEDIQLSTVLRPTASFVKVDPGQIEQVILNLAVNARDAMPQGGQLTIETSDIELDAAYTSVHTDISPGRFNLLAVSDTGVGMSREVRARIFEPFFTTKGLGRGTGLGLAVVHGIVKQSGGNVEVYSELGKGTTFKIYLPVVEGASADDAAPDASATEGGGETILLVEDEDSLREMTALALTGFGYVVLKASDGREAIQRMAEYGGRVDLLLTDVVMPEMSGRSLAETLGRVYPELKVLFISGYTDDAVMRHGVLQSEVAFLQKPFTLDGLARKVREVIGG